MRPFWQGPATPRLVRPMRGVSGPLQRGGTWSLELKWDGARAMAYVGGGRVRILSHGRDVTSTVPELQELAAAVPARNAVLDGALLGLDEDGRPDYEALQRRLHTTRPARDAPSVRLALFDVVHFDGRSQLDAPYEERRALLDALGLEGPDWTTPPSISGHEDPLGLAQERGAEGVIAKRRDSRYAAGRRVAAWITTRAETLREVVIGGWVPDERGRGVTAVLCGSPDPESPGRLRYLGRVRDVGAIDAMLLAEQFAVLRRHSSPFAGHVPSGERALACWVAPYLLAKVACRPGGDGQLRRARWRGLSRPEATELAA